MKRSNEHNYLSMHYNNVFLLVYSLNLIVLFLNTTMIRDPIFTYFDAITDALFILLVLIMVPKLVMVQQHDFIDLCLYLLLAVSFLGYFIYSDNIKLLLLLVLIIGSKDIPFNRIITLYCIISGTLILFIMLFSQVGLVENLIYHQARGTRISFGFVYPTDFTAHIFFFVMGYIYLRKVKMSYLELSGILGLSIFTYIFCDTRTNSLLLLITFFIFLSLKVYSNKRVYMHHFFQHTTMIKLLVLSMPICAFFIIGMTVLYHYIPGNIVTQTLNGLFSGRLYMGGIGLECYGIHLFGSNFPMIGFGGTTTPPPTYFFLDSSYVLILIRYGVLVFSSVIIMYALIATKAWKEGNITLLFILALISLQCMVEHHLLEMAYNPFTLLLFSEKEHEIKNGYYFSPRLERQLR